MSRLFQRAVIGSIWFRSVRISSLLAAASIIALAPLTAAHAADADTEELMSDDKDPAAAAPAPDAMAVGATAAGATGEAATDAPTTADPAMDAVDAPAGESQTVDGPQNAVPSSGRIEDLSLEQLMDIKVSTVSRQDSTVGQSPAAVFVITQEMIRRSGATTIPELFRMVPGMEVARIDSNSWAVGTRGFNSDLTNKLLVQMDGRTLYSPIYSGVYWDTVDYPLQDIERIEVVRGPGATVWGSNAVNGIINIITKAARDTQGSFVEAGAGTEDHGFGTFRYGGKSGDKGFFRVYGKGDEFDNSVATGLPANDDWRRAQTGFRMDRTTGETSNFTLQGDFFTVDTGRTQVLAGVNNAPSFLIVDNQDEESVGGNLLARWSGNVGKDNAWSLQAYYDRFDRHARSDVARTSIQTADIDYQRQFSRGERHRFIYGLGYRMQRILFEGSQSIDNSFIYGPASTRVDRDVWSAFLQDEIKLADKVSLTLGTKVERNDYTGTELQPSGRVLWTPSKRQTLWGAVSRAVRTPSLLENDISISLPLAPAVPIFLQLRPNTSLDSEDVVAHELGYRIQATKKLSFDTAVFYNKYKRLIAYNTGAVELGPAPGTIVLPLIFANNLKGHSYGVEVAANWNPTSRLKVTGAYTLTRINLIADSSVPISLRPSQENAEGQTPRHQLYLKASADLPRRLQFDVMSRFIGPLPRSGVPVPGYMAVDARLAWKKDEKMEVAIVGQNLFQSRHLEYGGGLAGSLQIERAVYGSVTWRW